MEFSCFILQLHGLEELLSLASSGFDTTSRRPDFVKQVYKRFVFKSRPERAVFRTRVIRYQITYSI